jgi:hypothetical protein
MKKLLHLAAACAALVSIFHSPLAAWTSSKASFDANGRLTYPADANGNRLTDFSNAGYKGGGVALPTVPVRVTISPVSGDDTASIQAAIDQVGAMPIQADGYRGAVLLTAGTYDVAGTIRLNKTGVVLAGVGDGSDPATNTVLRRTGTSLAEVIIAGGGSDDSFKTEIAGTRSNITTQIVQVGSRSFTVDNATLYAVGDNIVIWHPSTQAWIDAVDQGGVTDTNYWKPGEIDIRYHRYITAISGSTITVDAPVFTNLDRSLSQSIVYKYDRTGIVTNVGIEDIFVDIVTSGSTSEDHCEDVITFVEAEDSWIRDCTMQHFVHAGVQFGGTATRCTAERCRAIDPNSIITGGRRYNFCTYHAQLVLFKDCFASYGRHSFVCNGTSLDSGIVFLNGTIDHPQTFAEPHRRWSTGVLYDSIVTTNRGTDTDVLGLYNRGNYGTGHGWAAAHSLMWRCDAAGGKILVQQPPTAQNYAIGCFGNVTGSGPFAGGPGFFEGTNTSGLVPASLYNEQLAERLPLATPTFSPDGGTYSGAQSVTISTPSAGASIRYTTDGSTPSATVGTVYSGPIAISSTTTLKAIAYRTGWTSSAVASADYTISAPGGTTITSANGFVNVALSATQTGAFTATVAASPSISPSNAVVGLSSGAATGYTGIACMARFNTTGTIDARNGSGFTTGTIPFSANVTYTFRFVVNVATHTYSVYVTPAGGTEQTIGTSLAFRTETAAVTNLSHATFDVNPTPGGALTYWPVTVSGTPTPAKIAVPAANVIASADDGNVPANTVDGSLATRWSASGDGQWIRYDLGSTKTVSLVKIAFYNGDVRTSTFDVQTSSDGMTWTTRGSFTSSGTSLNLETFDSTDASARYVRVLGHGNSVNLWNSYTEVEVWGF